jgi:hypothetical protein
MVATGRAKQGVFDVVKLLTPQMLKSIIEQSKMQT